MKRKLIAYQHIRAENDSNGNPRRLWLVYDSSGRVAHVVDEGYAGRPYELTEGLMELTHINVKPAEYRAWIKYGKDENCLVRS